jgi:hypothetical protein
MPATAAKKKSIYSVHPGITMVQKWVAELKQNRVHLRTSTTR